jgi:ATP-dependent RNA helicase RhlE
VILDEADRLLDMGFAPEVKRLLGKCPTNRQTALFSATLQGEVQTSLGASPRTRRRSRSSRSA